MGETSIPCREETRDRLTNIRDKRYRSWDAFLNHLADLWECSDVELLFQTGDSEPADIAPKNPLQRQDTDAEAIAESFRREFPYDDLAETTAKKTADELEGRMR